PLSPPYIPFFLQFFAHPLDLHSFPTRRSSDLPESNYGYWYPGKNNDGGAGGGFEPRPWGHAWLGNKEMGRGSWWYSGEIDLGYRDRKSTRLNSSHVAISYAVFCLKKKTYSRQL